MAKTTTAAAPAAASSTPAVESSEQKIARLEAELAAKNEIIVGQAEQLQAAEAGVGEVHVVVTHEKKHYRVLAQQFSLEGKRYKAADLKENADLVKQLVESGSGILEDKDKAAAVADDEAEG